MEMWNIELCDLLIGETGMAIGVLCWILQLE